MQTCIELSFPLSSPRRSRNWHKSLRTPQQQRIIAILCLFSFFLSQPTSFFLCHPLTYQIFSAAQYCPHSCSQCLTCGWVRKNMKIIFSQISNTNWENVTRCCCNSQCFSPTESIPAECKRIYKTFWDRIWKYLFLKYFFLVQVSIKLDLSRQESVKNWSQVGWRAFSLKVFKFWKKRN